MGALVFDRSAFVSAWGALLFARRVAIDDELTIDDELEGALRGASLADGGRRNGVAPIQRRPNCILDARQSQRTATRGADRVGLSAVLGFDALDREIEKTLFLSDG
ncbi:MAG: hypothetical protein ACLPGW_16880 [Roseiarcus sp.]